MLRTTPPTKRERLVNELCTAAVELQALAQRLSNGEDLPRAIRQHADELARAGRVVALAAVSANDGHNPQQLLLFYGQFLTTSARCRERLDPLAEEGFVSAQERRANPAQSSEALAPRRAALSVTAMHQS